MAKPGRPPLDARAQSPSAAVHLKLSARDYDHVTEIARQRREKLQETIRRRIRRLIDDERGNCI